MSESDEVSANLEMLRLIIYARDIAVFSVPGCVSPFVRVCARGCACGRRTRIEREVPYSVIALEQLLLVLPGTSFNVCRYVNDSLDQIKHVAVECVDIFNGTVLLKSFVCNQIGVYSGRIFFRQLTTLLCLQFCFYGLSRTFSSSLLRCPRLLPLQQYFLPRLRTRSYRINCLVLMSFTFSYLF